MLPAVTGTVYLMLLSVEAGGLKALTFDVVYPICVRETHSLGSQAELSPPSENTCRPFSSARIETTSPSLPRLDFCRYSLNLSQVIVKTTPQTVLAFFLNLLR